MFKARIAAMSLKDCIEALNALVLEARFVFKPEGLSVKAVDPANVAMVSLDLSSKAFESYEADGIELGIDLKKMNEVLGMASKDEVIRLELDEVEHRLLITMRGLAYTMALIDPSAIRKEPKMPALVLPGHVTIRGEDFKRAVKAVGKISGYISVGIAGYSFFMVGEGDTDNVRFELTREQVVDLRPADVKALFSIDYLADVGKSAGKAEQITMDIGNDLPLQLGHSIACGNGSVMYVMAPRVESG